MQQMFFWVLQHVLRIYFTVIGGQILTSIFGKTVHYLVVFRISETKTV